MGEREREISRDCDEEREFSRGAARDVRWVWWKIMWENSINNGSVHSIPCVFCCLSFFLMFGLGVGDGC